MPDSQQVRDIRDQMAAIRCDLHDDVKGAVHNSRDMVDWRYYVRQYPWACMAATAAIGYLVVPSRLEVITPDADDLAKLAKRKRLVVKPKVEGRPRGGILGGLFGFLSNVTMRALIAYLGQQAGKIDTGNQRHKEPSHDPQQSRL